MMSIRKMFGIFCIISSHTCTTSRVYRQCAQRILCHKSTSADGSCTVVLISLTFHGRSSSLMKPSSPGKVFINFCNSQVWTDENQHATCPMAFSNAMVSTCGQGFWMDVLLGHTFFHLISLVTCTWIFSNTYCMGSWMMCRCMCIKTCDISTMAHHLILLVWFEFIWIEDLGKQG